MKRNKFFSPALMLEGIKQTRVVGICFAIISVLASCGYPLLRLISYASMDYDTLKAQPYFTIDIATFSMPIFLIQNLKIDSIRALSDGKHLKLTLKQDNYIIDAIGFNMGELSKQYLLGDKVDVVGTIEINTFGNKENIQMNLKDIRKAM